MNSTTSLTKGRTSKSKRSRTSLRLESETRALWKSKANRQSLNAFIIESVNLRIAALEQSEKLNSHFKAVEAAISLTRAAAGGACVERRFREHLITELLARMPDGSLYDLAEVNEDRITILPRKRRVTWLKKGVQGTKDTCTPLRRACIDVRRTACPTNENAHGVA